jgi:large subunit ribosomal protein L32
MANPKRRHSKQRKHLRRTHYKLKGINMSDCPSCKNKILPHRVCPHCGQYKGKQVIAIKEKTKKEK